jgi:hypothetical protein
MFALTDRANANNDDDANTDGVGAHRHQSAVDRCVNVRTRHHAAVAPIIFGRDDRRTNRLDSHRLVAVRIERAEPAALREIRQRQ